MNIKIIILLIVMLLTLQIGGSNKDKYKICGMAIDKNKKSVSNAHITLFSLDNNDLDDEGENGNYCFEGKTDEFGKFCIEMPLEYVSNNKVIFINGPINDNAINLAFPHSELTKNIKPYKVDEKISNLENISNDIPDEINIGEFEIQNKSCNLKINLKDSNGKPLINNLDDWFEVWTRIKNSKGKILREGNFSKPELEKSVILETSSINIVFPFGQFKVEISINDDKGPWKHLNNILVFDENSCNREISVIF